jgi:CMP-N-acetylneuraminic acid synthetase
MKLFLLGTAREGSTRVKNKMTRKFGDSSLYELYLEKFERLYSLNVFDGVGMAINRNDTKIWAMSQGTNVPIIERNDKSVKGITTRSEELHFLEDIDADYIMWINGCLPFLNTDTIVDAGNLFKNKFPEFKSMTAVREKYTWYWDSITKEAINNKDPKNVYTQRSKPLLETIHAFHIFSRKNLLDNDSYWNLGKNDPYLYTINNEIECMDIDTEVDFKICEIMWKLQNESLEKEKVSIV